MRTEQCQRFRNQHRQNDLHSRLGPHRSVTVILRCMLLYATRRRHIRSCSIRLLSFFYSKPKMLCTLSACVVFRSLALQLLLTWKPNTVSNCI